MNSITHYSYQDKISKAMTCNDDNRSTHRPPTITLAKKSTVRKYNACSAGSDTTVLGEQNKPSF